MDADLLRRWLLPAAIVLLIAAWLGGGVTVDDTAADDWLQLLALPVLVLAACVLCVEGVEDSLQRVALGMAALIFLVPVVQLLPLPDGWWSAVEARRALADDLRAAGAAAPHIRWTLSPAATETALWAMLPALAAFLAALALSSSQRRVMVKAVLLLVLGNVLFAFFQAGLPRDSALRLYQGDDSGFGGLLINTNHQATALIVGMVLATGQAVHAWHRQRTGRAVSHAWLWYAAFAGFCFLLIPLSTSRAGVALALPALSAALLLTGVFSLRRRIRSRQAIAGTIALLALAVVGVHAALGWMAVDQAEELRHSLASAAFAMGKAELPWGSGIGSFVPVFEQAAPPSLWLSASVNHAHNEYVQWWMEAGWLGMLVPLAVLAVLAVAGWRIVKVSGRGGHAILAASCFAAVCAVLAHSWVDFPLRTTTLMATTAALAGLMLAALADARRQAAASARAAQRRKADRTQSQPA